MKTTAVVPPYGDVCKETRTFCCWASRLHHEEAEAVGVGEFELGGLCEPQIGVQQDFGSHAEAAVVDFEGEAVGDTVAVHLDRGVRRREHRGVLQEFGDQVGEVGDCRASDADPRQAANLDPLVVLDLGDRCPHHVHQLDGLAPLPGRRRAGKNHETLGVPPHAGGEVVEAEEVGELVGVLGAALHGVQERQLAVQENLVAAGEVDEDFGDAASHVGLLDRGFDGGALQGVEGLADLADLVPLVTEMRGLGLDVDVFSRGEAAHHARQSYTGDLVGVLAEPGEVADEFAADADGHEDGDEQGEEAEDARDSGLDQDAVADGPTASWKRLFISVESFASRSRTGRATSCQRSESTVRGRGWGRRR